MYRSTNSNSIFNSIPYILSNDFYLHKVGDMNPIFSKSFPLSLLRENTSPKVT